MLALRVNSHYAKQNGCVTSFERQLTPLCADSARALWASFCFSLRQNKTRHGKAMHKATRHGNVR